MRVAIYNSMYSLNGKSFWDNLLGHWAVHYQGNTSQIWKRTKTDRTIEMIKKSDADIIGVCEVIEGQEKELEEKLHKLNYDYIFFGNGHRTKFNRLRIKVAIASKLKCLRKKIDGFPTMNEFGGGGGFVSCYFPRLKLNVLCIHFAILQNKILYAKQMLFLQKYIKKLRGKVVLLGDFNRSYKEIKSYFPDLKLASNCNKTCSITPIFKIFHFRDDDHILVKDLKVMDEGCISGHSDHKLLYAELA